jgi:cytochrome P450
MKSNSADAPIVYDPGDPATMASPFSVYDQLREHDPVHWSPVLNAWVVTRYEDVRAVLTGQDMTVDRLTPFYEKLPPKETETLREIVHYLNLWLAFQDPPRHTRLRRMLRTAFATPLIHEMRPDIEAIVDHVLGTLEGRDEIDFIAEFALLVPAYVIMDMLNVPRNMLEDFKNWADDMATFIGGARNIGDKYDRAARGCNAMAGYFRTILDAHRANPVPGFLDDMVNSGDGDDALSDDELIATFILILFAGHETTTNLIGTSLLGLMQHPDQMALFKADPELTESAVEEFLRYDGPTNALVRNVAHEHTLHGRVLRKGQRVFLMINSANRDPAFFEDPNRFDITRTPNRHLTFGQGIHTCLGLQLAREEGRIAVRRFIERYPHVTFAKDNSFEFIDAMVPRGLKRLGVRLKP